MSKHQQHYLSCLSVANFCAENWNWFLRSILQHIKFAKNNAKNEKYTDKEAYLTRLMLNANVLLGSRQPCMTTMFKNTTNQNGMFTYKNICSMQFDFSRSIFLKFRCQALTLGTLTVFAIKNIQSFVHTKSSYTVQGLYKYLNMPVLLCR